MRLSPIAQTAPCTSQMFTGREQYLEALKRHFKPEDPYDLTRKYFLLFGMGGIGKTQIGLKYIDDTEDQYEYMFWIDSTSEESVVQSLKDIFKTYLSDGALAFSPAAILGWISNLKCRWLMIFDNADDSAKVVEKYLPPKNKGNLLITSRNQALRKIATSEQSMEVTEMNESTAVQLLLKVSGLYQQIDLYKDTARKIVSELYGIPLAIDHAGAYIMSGSCDITDFLSMYRKQRMNLLDNTKYSGTSNYNKTIYGTWEISYQKIVEKSEDEANNDEALVAKYALTIINLSAFFHHEKIPHSIFRRAAENYHETVAGYDNENKCCVVKHMDKELFNLDENGDWNEIMFTDAIALLFSYALVKQQGNGDQYGLHPLVKNWCQDRISQVELKLWICNAIGMLATSIKSDATGAEEYIYDKSITIHIIEILSYDDVQDNLQDYEMLTRLADALGKAAMFNTELTLRDKIMKLCIDILGEHHTKTLKSLHDLTISYSNLGMRKEAEELQLKALEVAKNILGEEHPNTVHSMGSLAVIYEWAGKLKEAEELKLKVLQMRTRILGEEHPDTVGSMANLACTYRSLGKFKEAAGLEDKVLEMRTKILGEEDLATIQSMTDLACTYREVWKLKDAVELEIKALEMRTRILGEEHPDTVSSMASLACTYRSIGNLKEAAELRAKVLKMRTKILGEEHPDTLWSMGNLASTYQGAGRLKEAEELKLKVLQMRTRILGEEHPDTLWSMANLAWIYLVIGKLKEAEELEVKALDMRTRILGKEHPDTLESMADLAWTYEEVGKLEEAEELELSVLELRARILGKEHPDTLWSMANLAWTYLVRGKFKEAEELEVKALEIRTRILGEEHTDTIRSMANLASTYRKLGKKRDAQELEAKVSTIRARIYREGLEAGKLDGLLVVTGNTNLFARAKRSITRMGRKKL